MIVDAHHHLWHVGGGYDWLDAPELAPIRRTFGPEDLRAELSAAGVAHTVLVEGGRCDAGEAALLLAHAAGTPQIAGVVAWDDPAAPAFPAYRDLPGAERLVGLRAQVQAEDAGYLDRDWERWTPGDLRPYFEPALELFGPERLMFGSDWPVCRLAAGYGRVLAVATELVEPLTTPAERALVFGGTAVEVYRLPVGGSGIQSPRRR